MRIPRFGRALAYHFPSADALVGAAGPEVYRFNLEQGRFLAPFNLEEDGDGQAAVAGVNAVDVNPAHGLLSFGTEGAGSAGVVQLWDPRARRRAGTLRITSPAVLDAARAASMYYPGLPSLSSLNGTDASAPSGLAVTALSSAQDGLNLAVGTSTGHTLLYDLRMSSAYATKDQGFSLPIKSLCWPGDRAAATFFDAGGASSSGAGAPSAEAHGTVLSADAKVVKVWSKEEPSSNIVTLTPPSSAVDLNDVHQIPGTGLILAAVEGTQMAAWYVPTLGVAPRWCNFLDTITDEMDGEPAAGSTGAGAGASAKGVYEDFKFVDKAELARLGMENLIGTDVLRPYMHGYFVKLALYERAKLVANPDAFADARERAIRKKLEREAESRIRGSAAAAAAEKKRNSMAEKVKVNKDLAAKLERQSAKMARAAAAQDGDAAEGAETPEGTTLLQDDRFKELFTNPEFQVDTTSREYFMLNPNAANKRTPGEAAAAAEEDEGSSSRKKSGERKLTAVEDEMMEGDYDSSDDDDLLGMRDRDYDDDEDASDDDGGEDVGSVVSDESSEGDDDRIMRPTKKAPAPAIATKKDGVARGGARLIDGDGGDADDAFSQGGARRKSFQERMKARSAPRSSGSSDLGSFARKSKNGGTAQEDFDDEGGMELSWTPAAVDAREAKVRSLSGLRDEGDGDGAPSKKGRGSKLGRKGGEKAERKDKSSASFGMGLSKGAGAEHGVGVDALTMEQRLGRQRRRNTSRSASKNVMRGSR